MTNQNWRTEVNSGDYFSHQQKKLQIADRRPVIRKASDLVGPGIAPNSVRLTNFNDLLATYDGFFSADVGAASAPNDTDAFVGFVSSDTQLGGAQEFSSLSDGKVWQRVFTRSPLDPSAIYWGTWETSVETGRVSALEDRATTLEGRAGALEGRATALEGSVKPLYTGMFLFYMTNIPQGGTATGVVDFEVDFPVLPACWAIRAGFVSGGSLTMVSMVDNVTTTGCRVTITNMGPTDATFTDMPVRWFAQEPG